MNLLPFDSIFWQSWCSTSQPGQRKNLCKSASPLWLLTKYSSYLFRAWPRYRKDPFPCRVASSFSSDHSSQSHAAPDATCFVCGSHSLTACPVCDQDFCSIHLYTCLDCDNQYCGRCLDEHRAEGHWTDSDTVVELNRGRRALSLWPTEKDGLVHPASKGLGSEQFANESRTSAILAAARNQSLPRFLQFSTLTLLPSPFARALHVIRGCLEWLGARTLRNMFSQSVDYPEVRL